MPEGSLDFKYFDVDVRNHNTWIGFTGDATAQNGNIYSEVNEVFYRTKQQDIDMDDVASFASESINGGYAWWGQDGGYSSGQIVVTHSTTHHVMDMQTHILLNSVHRIHFTINNVQATQKHTSTNNVV